MRLAPLALALLVAITRVAVAAIPLPDTPTVTDLDEFQLRCQSQQAAIGLMESTGQKEKAAELRARLWERYDAELVARRCQLADLSLAALNPFIPAEERKAAADSLGATVAQIARLSTFHTPDAAERVRHLELAGQRPTEAQRERADTHATLKKIREQLAREALAHPEIADLLRDLVAQLTRAAAAKQPLGEILTQVRALPSSGDAYQNLTQRFAEPGLIEALFLRTGESLALEATLTALIAADPANATFWLARARARAQLGWRAGATLDLTVAVNIQRDVPGADALTQRLKETPVSVAALCQEWVDPESANEVIRQHRMAQMGGLPVTGLAPALERTARAAVRNRARRLYATSFVNKPELRARAIRLIAEENPLPPGLFPFVGPELGQQYEAALAAAGNDRAKHFAIQQGYAAIFGITEGFWHKQIALLLALREDTAAFAATDVATAVAPQADWLPLARQQLERLRAATAPAAK